MFPEQMLVLIFSMNTEYKTVHWHYEWDIVPIVWCRTLIA